MSNTKSPVGAIFPIGPLHAKRIFEDKKTVFVKFTEMANFKVGSKIVFYITKEKVLCGEGTIKTFQRLSTSEVLSKYGKDLFLNQDEFNYYTNWSSVEGKKRKQSEIAVFALKSLKKYSTPFPIKGITSSGVYFSKEEYDKLTTQ